MQKPLPQELPFAAFAAQAVDNQRGRVSGRQGHARERTVSHITDEHYLCIAKEHMDDRQKTMKQRVEMHAGNAGQNHPANAAIENVVRRSKRFSAVNRYRVTALYQTFGKLVCERLKPAVASGNTASTNDCNVHQRRSISAASVTRLHDWRAEMLVRFVPLTAYR